MRSWPGGWQAVVSEDKREQGGDAQKGGPGAARRRDPPPRAVARKPQASSARDLSGAGLSWSLWVLTRSFKGNEG